MTRVNSQIFFLKNLTSLSLSDNVIKEVPKQLGELRLAEIDMSKNSLGEMTGSKQWQWLEGRLLQASLVSLNLSGNNVSSNQLWKKGSYLNQTHLLFIRQLTHFPLSLVKLSRLTVLKLDNNTIAKLPFAIRRMRALRFLHLSQNRLTSLPHTLTRCTLNTLDISNNEFNYNVSERLPFVQSAVADLWELAARAVSAHRYSFYLLF